MDLSRLPEPLRSKLEKQMAALPAEYRATLEKKLAELPTDKLEQVLSKTTPLLDRMAKKQSSSAGRPSNSATKSASTHASGTIQGYEPNVHRNYDPHDHYNNTVGRGDISTPPLLVIICVVFAVLMFLNLAGWFD
jgi:hypothetical protein